MDNITTFDLDDEQLKDLRSRVKDFDNPIRYAVYHGLMRRKFLHWHDSSSDFYCNDMDGATLYKRYKFAKVIADATGLEYVKVAKLTIKNDKVRVVKYDYNE